MPKAIWKKIQLTQQQAEQQQKLINSLSLNPVLAALYVKRGLLNADDIEHFVNPQAADLYDPFLYKDMDKAVDRLNRTIQNNENILIYGDYDVDGTTAVALVYRYLSQFYDHLGYYVPDRDTEGYGVSTQGIDYAVANHYTLIIALDCGIKDIEEIQQGRLQGIDFIICDHHNPDEQLPDAVAVLDAKRSDNTYPYTELSGCGVGYKFMQAFAQTNHHDPQLLEPLLDLLALSIASDIVPLTGENRILFCRGLQQINTNPSLGIATLIKSCELNIGSIDINDIGYKIGPRINASGRIDTANNPVQLMITGNRHEAEDFCRAIEEHNQQRRDLDRLTTEQALEQIASNEQAGSQYATIVYSPDWHKGVVGIVASRLIEKHYKPTIVLTQSNGLITGSARSVAGFDLYSAIQACASDLEAFGGHTYAAGLSMKPEFFESFKLHFEQYVAAHISQEQKMPIVEYDEEIPLSLITDRFFDDLQQLQPYGQDNPQPVFVTRGVYNVAGTRVVGQKQEHLRLEISDGTIKGKIIGIAFGQAEYDTHFRSGKKADICYTIEANNFRGTRSLQLHVTDIKVSE